MEEQTIGIFTAMALEARLLKKQMTDKEEKTIGGIVFSSGKIGNKKVVLTVSGPGTDNAVQAVTTLILLYQVDLVIVCGLAGSLSEKAGPLSLIIGDNLINWEVDVTPANKTMKHKKDHYMPGQMYGEKSELHKTGSNHSTLLAALAGRLFSGKTILTGTILTGNSFVTSELKKQLKKTFPADRHNPLCVDMESASVVKICNKFSVESAVLRITSDNADNNAPVDFLKIARQAADESQQLILEFLKEL